MGKVQRSVWGGMILLLLMGLLAGCGSTSPTSKTLPAVVTATPTPKLPPMVRVTIQIDDVFCNGKQSVYWWQMDKFYMLTTFSGSGPTATAPVVTQSQLSEPVDIGNNQNMAIPPGPLVVFNALLPMDGSIRGGFKAFNGGVADDQIAQFASWGFSIAEKVSGSLQDDSIDSGELDEEPAATIVNIGSQAFLALLGPSDNPTELGNQPIEITANGPHTDPETLSFVQNSGPGNTWNYLIHYTITRTFTN